MRPGLSRLSLLVGVMGVSLGWGVVPGDERSYERYYVEDKEDHQPREPVTRRACAVVEVRGEHERVEKEVEPHEPLSEPPLLVDRKEGLPDTYNEQRVNPVHRLTSLARGHAHSLITLSERCETASLCRIYTSM